MAEPSPRLTRIKVYPPLAEQQHAPLESFLQFSVKERKRGRAVEGSSLENCSTARYRGFESHRFLSLTERLY